MSDFSHLNPEQLQAVTFGEGPLLIIAGAGTGKTTVITERVKHLIIDKKINSANILALTFTEKASTEMEERIDIALPYGYNNMWIETFHGFCDRVLRNEAIQIGLDPSYKLASPAESILFLKKNLFKLKLDYFRPLGNPNKFLEALLQHFSRLKDEDITTSDYQKFAEELINIHSPASQEYEERTEEIKKIRELSQAYMDFEEMKIQESIMDFGDLLSYTLKLFRTRKHILKQYQNMFEYILIDEFQDTNYAQNELAKILAGEKQNITVVGDDDQAIYRWRGAAISNMIQFREHFPRTTIVTLTKNYRSSAPILDSAYQLIQHNNPDRLEIKEHINKKLEAMRHSDIASIEFLLFQKGEDEAEAVVKKIKELIRKHKYTYKDFAILVRANDHAQLFIRALENARMPYQFLGPGELFNQEEIKDIIAYLKVLANFEDSSAMYRVLTMPIWELTGVDIAILLNMTKRKRISLFETLNFLDETPLKTETKQKLLAIKSAMETHFEQMSQKSPATQVIVQFLTDSGLMRKYLELSDTQDIKRAENVAKLFDRLRAFETSHNDISVFSVIDWIELSMNMGESPQAATMDISDINAVRILTIHSSKGLEFPVVFIANMISQRFPSRERREPIPLPEGLIKEILPEGDYHLQEERRLAYVAITRAKDKLYMTASNFYGDGKRERKISPFVIEAIGSDNLEKAKLKKTSQINQLSLLDSITPIKSPLLPESNGSRMATKITYLSYSQMQTFDICPLHYKLKYIMHVPTPQSTAQSFGTSIHGALKDYYTLYVRGEKPTLDIIPEILQTNWIAEGYETSEHEKLNFDKAIEIVKTYITKEFDPTREPVAIELPFMFFVKHLRVGGRIDRIDRLPDGTLEIIDYKTGHNVPTQKSLAENFQLSLYALASTEIPDPILKRDPEQIKLSLYYLEKNTKLTTTRTRDQLLLAKEEILKTAEAIQNSSFLCSHSMLCMNCEYKLLCNKL